MGIFTKTGYNKKYLLTHPYEVILHFCRDIHCAWQRATKGYCYRDLWNIDLWFIDVFPRMLKDFKDTSISYPITMKSPEEWEDLLSHMIFCFNEANEETCSLKNEKNYNFNVDFIETEDNTKTIKITFPTEEDKKNSELYSAKDRELTKYRQEMLKEGLSLFVEHFQNLWN